MRLFGYILSFILFCAFFNAQSQFSDDFSDGDFISNPEWKGDTSRFEVLSGQLHLNDTMANISYLSSQSGALYEAGWEFWINMKLSWIRKSKSDDEMVSFLDCRSLSANSSRRSRNTFMRGSSMGIPFPLKAFNRSFLFIKPFAWVSKHENK